MHPPDSTAGGRGLKPTITIAVTRYDEPDAVIRQSLHHALCQRGVAGEVLFIDQGGASGFADADFPDGCLALRRITRRLGGLSEARNLALDEAGNRLVLFLDADALADPDWARGLAEVLQQDDCAVAGAKVVPRWPGRPPLFAKSNVLRDQYSLLDLGDETRPYHRVVGAGFGMDMTKLPDGFRFNTGLGRREGLLFGGEESDVCTRARALGFGVAYVGGARVVHLISAERCNWRWILKRMFYAGYGRACQGGAPSASGRATIFDWLLMPAYFPFYVAGWISGKRSQRLVQASTGLS